MAFSPTSPRANSFTQSSTSSASSASPATDERPKLLIALENGDAREVAELLRVGTSPNARWSSQSTTNGVCTEVIDNTPLHIAAENGQADAISFLLEAGARPNVNRIVKKTRIRSDTSDRKPEVETTRETPLHVAVRSGFVSSVKTLLDGGADLRKTDHQNRNAMEVHRRLAQKSTSSRAASELMKRYLNWEYFVRVQVLHCHSLHRTSLPLAHCQMRSTYPALRWHNVKNMAEHLTHLDLSHNSLTSIAPEIAVLRSLVVLNVSHNNIRRLPHTLAVLDQLVDLNVKENPLVSPAKDVLKRGTKAVLSFLQSKRDESIKANEVKVVMIGDRGVGKTTLCNTLSDDRPEAKRSIRSFVKSMERTSSSSGVSRSADSDSSSLTASDPSTFCFSLKSTLAVESLQQVVPNYFKSSEKHLRALCRKMQAELDVRDLSFELQRIPQCVLGIEVVDWLLDHKARTRQDAVAIGNKCLEYGLLEHPTTNRLFEDKRLPYCFIDVDSRKNQKKMKSASKVVFNLWDINGDRIVEESKQILFSDGAIYILVWNLENLSSDSGLETWLQAIASRTKQSSVALVGTHADADVFSEGKIDIGTKLTTTDNKLSPRFPFIVHITSVSFSDVMSLQDLQARLVSLSLQRLARTQPHPFKYDILNQLFQLERQRGRNPPLVVWDELLLMGTTVDLQAEELRAALMHLHMSGNIVLFPSSSTALHLQQDVVLLDLCWLLNAFASIAASSTLLVRGAILRHELLPRIWTGAEYPERVFDVLVDLLIRKELLFRIPRACVQEEIKQGSSSVSMRSGFNVEHTGDPGTSLIPSLLSESEPNDVLSLWGDGVDFSDPALPCFYRMIVLSFLPATLFSRMLIHTLSSTDRVLRLWKSGVCFEKGRARVLVRVLSRYKRKAITLSAVEIPQATDRDPSNERSVENGFCSSLALARGLCEEWFDISVNQFAPCPSCISKHADRSTKQGESLIFRGHPIHLIPIAAVDAANFSGSHVPCDEGCAGVEVASIAPDVTRINTTSAARLMKPSEFVVEKTIGTGSFGRVCLARHMQTQECVAFKELMGTVNPSLYATFRHEVGILECLSHMNIISLVGLSVNPPIMMLEYCPHSDLYTFMHSDSHRGFSWHMRVCIAHEVACALDAMHSCNPPILHRDVKSPNVLVQSRSPYQRPATKLTDFGESVILHTGQVVRRVVQTPTWLAPEVLYGEPYSAPSDIYPLGVIMWELLTYAHPFLEYQFSFTHQLEDAIKRGSRPSLPEPPVTPEDFNALSERELQVVADEFYVLLQQCWQENPLLRPSAAEVKRRTGVCLQLFTHADDVVASAPIQSLSDPQRSASVCGPPPPTDRALHRDFRSMSVVPSLGTPEGGEDMATLSKKRLEQERRDAIVAIEASHSMEHLPPGIELPEPLRSCRVDGRDLLASRCAEVVRNHMRLNERISEMADKAIYLRDLGREIEAVKHAVELQQRHSEHVKRMTEQARLLVQKKLDTSSLAHLPATYPTLLEHELLRFEVLQEADVMLWRKRHFPETYGELTREEEEEAMAEGARGGVSSDTSAHALAGAEWTAVLDAYSSEEGELFDILSEIHAYGSEAPEGDEGAGEGEEVAHHGSAALESGQVRAEERDAADSSEGSDEEEERMGEPCESGNREDPTAREQVRTQAGEGGGAGEEPSNDGSSNDMPEGGEDGATLHPEEGSSELQIQGEGEGSVEGAGDDEGDHQGADFSAAMEGASIDDLLMDVEHLLGDE